jgi:hypothetical protein
MNFAPMLRKQARQKKGKGSAGCWYVSDSSEKIFLPKKGMKDQD